MVLRQSRACGRRVSINAICAGMKGSTEHFLKTCLLVVDCREMMQIFEVAGPKKDQIQDGLLILRSEEMLVCLSPIVCFRGAMVRVLKAACCCYFFPLGVYRVVMSRARTT